MLLNFFPSLEESESHRRKERISLYLNTSDSLYESVSDTELLALSAALASARQQLTRPVLVISTQFLSQ